jgi:hypothetical protein
MFAGKSRRAAAEDLGISRLPLCLEPWQSYYILRRGIMPCCYGNPVLAPMTEYARMWNSAELQEIRSFLSRGELSPYCHKSLGCPIVQRVLAKKAAEHPPPPPRPAALRFINRLFFRLPGRLWRSFGRRSQRGLMPRNTG